MHTKYICNPRARWHGTNITHTYTLKAAVRRYGSNNNKRIAQNKLLCTKSIFVRIIIIQFDRKFMNINSVKHTSRARTHTHTDRDSGEWRERKTNETANDNLLIEKMATQGDRTIYSFSSFYCHRTLCGRFGSLWCAPSPVSQASANLTFYFLNFYFWRQWLRRRRHLMQLSHTASPHIPFIIMIMWTSGSIRILMHSARCTMYCRRSRRMKKKNWNRKIKR